MRYFADRCMRIYNTMYHELKRIDAKICCNHQYAPQFHPPIALRTDLSHITTELWETPVLRMAH